MTLIKKRNWLKLIGLTLMLILSIVFLVNMNAGKENFVDWAKEYRKSSYITKYYMMGWSCLVLTVLAAVLFKIKGLPLIIAVVMLGRLISWNAGFKDLDNSFMNSVSNLLNYKMYASYMKSYSTCMLLNVGALLAFAVDTVAAFLPAKK